jgi:LmbE family N-acetylglucosaminyl deacetylase
VREVRPQVMVGYNDFGGYGHPDHIRAALITKAAFERAADDPQPPLKLYEVARDWTGWRRSASVPKSAAPSVVATAARRDRRAAPRARAADGRDGRRQGPITTRVDVPTTSPPSTPR